MLEAWDIRRSLCFPGAIIVQQHGGSHFLRKLLRGVCHWLLFLLQGSDWRDDRWQQGARCGFQKGKAKRTLRRWLGCTRRERGSKRLGIKQYSKGHFYKTLVGRLCLRQVFFKYLFPLCLCISLIKKVEFPFWMTSAWIIIVRGLCLRAGRGYIICFLRIVLFLFFRAISYAPR